MQKKLRQPNFPQKLASLDPPVSSVVDEKASSTAAENKYTVTIPTSQSLSSRPSSSGGMSKPQNELETKFHQTEHGGRVEIKSPEKRQLQISIHPHDRHSTDSLCDNIDSLALWISPIIFICFNVIYWMTYF